MIFISYIGELMKKKLKTIYRDNISCFYKLSKKVQQMSILVDKPKKSIQTKTPYI